MADEVMAAASVEALAHLCLERLGVDGSSKALACLMAMPSTHRQDEMEPIESMTGTVQVIDSASYKPIEFMTGTVQVIDPTS